MACFCGTAYTDVEIDRTAFLPVQVKIGKQDIVMVNKQGILYPQFEAKEEAKQHNQKANSAQLTEQTQYLTRQINEKEQQLLGLKNEIKDLSKHIEILNDLMDADKLNEMLAEAAVTK